MQNELLKDKVIDVPIGINTSYILESDNLFYDIGFQVMKNQKIESLLSCHKLKYNGKIKLVYMTADMFPFDRFLAEAEVENIYTIIYNLFNAINEIKNNGFLNIACIDNRNNRMFVDKSTMNVKLIYLPIDISTNLVYIDKFDNEIRTMILQELQNNRWAFHPKIQECIEMLKNGKEIKVVSKEKEFKKLLLTRKNTDISFVIDKAEYKIGRNPDLVDGVILGSPLIGRLHCKIIQKNNKIYVVDCASLNYTYVNDYKISANQEVEITFGTKIRLADMEFELRRYDE